MAAGTQTTGWSGPSRRRVPRFRMQAPLDVTVLRSGIPDTVPGRSTNVCERGLAAVLAGELVPGETVGVEVQLSPVVEPFRTRATVRYQDELRCGLEFVAISPEQRATIRDWAKEAQAETDVRSGLSPVSKMGEKKESAPKTPVGGPKPPSGTRNKRRGWWWLAVVLIVMGAAIFWWRWNRAWDELEAGRKSPELTSAEKPRAQVPAEVMQKLLVHRVEPLYPTEARKENLQGIIALEITVGRDGSVLSMHALNGPDVLARAAMDALRWWKFEPYRINGEPVLVESTVAVEFKR